MEVSRDNYLQVEEIAWKKGPYDIEVCGIFNKAKKEEIGSWRRVGAHPIEHGGPHLKNDFIIKNDEKPQEENYTLAAGQG